MGACACVLKHREGLLQVPLLLQCLGWSTAPCSIAICLPGSSILCTNALTILDAHARSFLGLLHMEVFLQRLEQEHGASVITTAPTVPYALDLYGGARLEIQNPSQVRACLRCWRRCFAGPGNAPASQPLCVPGLHRVHGLQCCVVTMYPDT